MTYNGPRTGGTPPGEPSVAGASTGAGLAVLASACVLGVLGDALLRIGPWGINATLWLAGFLAALVVLRRRLAPAQVRTEAAWASVALAFALALAWRDSIALKLLDLAAVGTIVSLPFLRPLGARLRSATLTALGAAGVLAGLHAAFGAVVLILSDIRWRELRGERRSARVLATARGVALALPLLAVFGALLVAADAVFAHFVTEVLEIDIERIVWHLIVAGFIAWVAAGVLRGVLFKERVAPFWDDLPLRPHLGVVETVVALGLVDLLFLSFVVVQVRYLFGGEQYLGSVPGLTYAAYARAGFFELVAVAALAIPMLLLADWLLRCEDARSVRTFRALAGMTAVLLSVIMASALRRMLLYTEEYGLSEQRLYTLACMAYLAAVLAWFALTVLRGRRERFAGGALIAGLAVVAALNVCNPESVIARVNLDRAAASRRFDARYASTLSADATPELVSGLAALDREERAAVIAGLARKWQRLKAADWRTWSWSRARALRALESAPDEVRALPAGAREDPRSGGSGPPSLREQEGHAGDGHHRPREGA